MTQTRMCEDDELELWEALTECEPWIPHLKLFARGAPGHRICQTRWEQKLVQGDNGVFEERAYDLQDQMLELMVDN
jgi:hypothetical protein